MASDGPERDDSRARVRAPGRVNLIGDHTDYTGGLVFPMAIDRATTIDFESVGHTVELTSDSAGGDVCVPLPVDGDPATVEPSWGRYVAAMASELGATTGLRGRITSGIPAGAGLSSSAALECAVALALDFEGSPAELARTAQRAEHAATGVPTGIMDQLCIAAATAGHGVLIDCHTLDVRHVPVPDDLDVVVHFVAHRTLVGSAYADRVAECARAEQVLGPLRSATVADVDTVEARAALDQVTARRARHVVTENARVTAFADAIAAGDHVEAGRLMTDSHRSLRDDFETSTPAMDAAVERAAATPGVFGARMTGGGFGGCIVALAEAGTATGGWRVRPVRGVHRL